MIVDWRPLMVELEIWHNKGLSLPLWWRDDDATTTTQQLDRLTALSDRLGLPVHLAVIPHDAGDALTDHVTDNPCLIPVVHGWAHQNHAPQGEKKSEFRLHRPMSEILKDAQNGLDRLKVSFGERLCPMFVPPWNRIAPDVVKELPDLGYQFLSTATPRNAAYPVSGLQQVNTHLDPIDWRRTRGLIAPDVLINQAVDLLRDRREGRTDNAEPFGVLTHHLVHDEDIWTFTRDLLHRLLDGPAVIWTALQNDTKRRPE
ncbi:MULTISPECIES: polysaccharide deacetylase family protein [unclassified Ruegeria]|uniref:polysaccharide deacetylase family protein n=1 Tax=unclassified Ruegeria TaxID=2625375 RepID=UPI001488D798|nr:MULTISPECIES: polysaccharide deacetylase family protein [unclassified Ruegeria]